MLEKVFGKKVKDERVTALNRRVATEGYWIFFWGMLILFLHKALVLQRPFVEWRSEWALFLFVACYSCVRQVMLGVPLSTRKMRVDIKIVCSVCCAAGFFFTVAGLSTFDYGRVKLVVTATVAGIFCFLLLLVMEKLIARRNRRQAGDTRDTEDAGDTRAREK